MENILDKELTKLKTGKEYQFINLGLKKIKGKNTYLLKAPDGQIARLKQSAVDRSLKLNSKINCIILDITPKGYYILEYRRDKVLIKETNKILYEIGKIYTFKYVNTIELERGIENKLHTYYILQDQNGQEHKLFKFKWEKETEFETIDCQITEILANGSFKLRRTLEPEHLFFKIGETYSFKFIDWENKELKDGSKRSLIRIKGVDNLIYKIFPVPGQVDFKFQPETIKCKFEGIKNSNVHLRQIDSYNPFFISIDEIVIDKSIQNLAFHNFRAFKEEQFEKMFRDYDNKEAKWIFSYCNILADLIFKKNDVYDYKSSLILIDILILCENHILSSGLVKSFRDSEKRKSIVKYSKGQIQKFVALREAIQSLLDLKYNEFIISKLNAIKGLEEINDDIHNDITAIINLFRCSDPDLINVSLLFETVNVLGEKQIFKQYGTEGEKHLRWFRNNIGIRKSRFKVSGVDLLHHEDNLNRSLERKSLLTLDLLILQYLEVLINRELKDNFNYNLSRAIFYKYKAQLNVNSSYKKKLIKNSIRILYNLNEVFNDSYFDWQKSEINLLEEKKIIQPVYVKTKFFLEEWKKLVDSFQNQLVVKVNVTGKDRFGLNINYNGVAGFIPYVEVSELDLKAISIDRNSEIDCKVTLVDNENYFFISTSKNLFSKEVQQNVFDALEEGQIIYGVIKNIVSYGVFISLGSGLDGLLRIVNISNSFIDPKKLNQIFTIGQQIPVVILELDSEDKRIDLGFKQLSTSNFSEVYEEIINNSEEYSKPFVKEESNDLQNGLVDKILKEKAFCFDYYSFLTESLGDKINRLEWARSYYRLIGSSKAYYLQASVKYFKYLLEFDKKGLVDLIESAKALFVELKTDELLIKNFPATSKIIEILNLITLFNSLNKDDFDYLYFKSITDDSALEIKKLSKIILSNNLIASEEIEKSFTNRNWQRINKFLKDGIINLQDSETYFDSDLDEKTQELIKLIKIGENHTVEFKSTFRWDINQDKINKGLENEVLKTIAAFSNANGGKLFIGVNDDGLILGLENDYKILKKGEGSKDEFELELRELVKKNFGIQFCNENIIVSFQCIGDNEFCLVEVVAAKQPVFINVTSKSGSTEVFYVRNGNSSHSISIPSEIYRYINSRFGSN